MLDTSQKRVFRYICFDLFEVLPWWINALNCMVPRRLECNPGRPVLVYTDACGGGHLGACVYDGGQVWFSHTHEPQWMRSMSINIKEMAAALLGICVVAEVSRKKQVLLRCDNTGAKGMIIRGSSANVFGRGQI